MSVITYSDFNQLTIPKIHSGCYQLVLRLEQVISLEVGSLCRLNLSKGYYLYTGRHRKSLWRRIERHLQKDKRVYWHIDYFTTHPAIQMDHIIIFPETDAECKINQEVQHFLNARLLYPGLGSGDCNNKCGAHMQYVEDLLEEDINKWLLAQSEFKPVLFSASQLKLQEIHA